MKRTEMIIMWVLITAMVLGYFYFCNPRKEAGKEAEKREPLVTETQPATPVGEVKEVVLGGASPEDPFRTEVTVSTMGAGIQRVRLNAKYYTQKVGTKDPMTLFAAAEGPKPFATHRVKVGNGPWVPLVYLNWLVDPEKKGVSKTEVTLGAWLAEYKVRIRKTYRIDPATYDMYVTHTIINEADVPQKVTIDQFGPANMVNDNYQADSRNFQGAFYDTGSRYIKGAAQSKAGVEVDRGGRQWLGSCGYSDPLVWFAMSNRFFTTVVRPLGRAGHGEYELADKNKLPIIDYMTEVHVDQTSAFPASEPNKLYATHVTGAAVEVDKAGSPNSRTDLPWAVFMGPKERSLLEGNEKASGAGAQSEEYKKNKYIELIHFSQGGPCGYCTFAPVAKAILWLLDVIHVIVRNWGVAIMVLVIVVRLCLHPLTRYSQVNMATMQKKMAALQPELEKVKKRYAKDKQQQNAEMMKLYKEHNVNPAGGVAGCLPMFIQMPIWMALYAGLAIDIDLRHAWFIPGWISDLSSPDTMLPFPPPAVGHPLFHVPLLNMPIYGLNLLPLLLAVVFFIQMKITAKTMPQAKPSADDEQAKQQAQMQKMSQWMIMLFPVFLYNAPSGLNLYIFASTLGGLFDTWLVRRHMRAKGLLPEPVKKG